MLRLLVVVALLALPTVASAQANSLFPYGYTVTVGPPMLDGNRVVGPPITDGYSALYPVPLPAPPRFSVGGGSMSGPQVTWLPSGGWGDVYYPWPVYPVYVQPNPPPRPPATGRLIAVHPQLGTSAQLTASLVMQFPVAAEIWVDGKKRDGNPAAEWTLTSPTLKAGEAHTFEVKGRWKVDKKTFEASRSVTVLAGERNRVLVVSGTEVK
jgi:uncharacterized protein (TIGR03000 family)